MTRLKNYLTSKKLWFTVAIALPAFIAVDAFLPSLSQMSSLLIKLGIIMVMNLMYDAMVNLRTSSGGKETN